ncbi:hypothetical protein FHW67_002785 [Herbaspirillum sp. Sphag1AN]|uniref:hypothetical protein n=1 Tax=unclassified Herbaspirillum TaxID=2624150 RepID=UPI0016162A00|nr:MULTISPECIES: hypothetical protein [unclassified Herbaspirillum]MBB3213487.1 hypothetical protein [Herbaspirillum sp. Sphag1AN]MBB3246685.1 hypothetical protein [Herbaspirillum sp. Sphag64]
MKKFNFLIVLVGLSAALAITVHATSIDLRKIESIFNKFNLQRYEYSEKGNLRIEKFKSNVPLSEFTSEFDQRIVIVVLGKKTIVDRPKVEPLVPEQILSKIHSKRPEKYNGWTLSTDEIIYAAQGQVPGFMVDCTVAGKMFKNDYVTVSECYSLDKKKEFLKILSAFH